MAELFVDKVTDVQLDLYDLLHDYRFFLYLTDCLSTPHTFN